MRPFTAKGTAMRLFKYLPVCLILAASASAAPPRHETAGDGPIIGVTPTSLDTSQPVDTTTVQVLSITNTGTSNLFWAIREVETISPTAPSAAVINEGFDNIGTLGGDGWFFLNQSDPLGGTNWFQGNGDFPAFDGPPTAYIAADFNNGLGHATISNWLVTPEITFDTGAAGIFYTAVPPGSTSPDRLQVRLCTGTPCTDVGTTATDVGDFTTLLLDINPTYVVGGYPEAWAAQAIPGLPESGTGRIAFRYFVEDGGAAGSRSSYIGIDRVVIDNGGPCNVPGELPWASVIVQMGSTAPGATSPLTVTFDSTGLAPGTHSGLLCVLSNDLANSQVQVPVSLTVTTGDGIEFFGPTLYWSAADTPAEFTSGPMAIENFEDGVADSRIILAPATDITGPGGLTDSVDADDGAINGSGTDGHSLYDSAPIDVEFVLPLPTSAGLVWTDALIGSSVTFEAFGPDNQSIGSIGPFTIGDNVNNGTTAEDRFFGVRADGGVLRLRITPSSGDLEIDHIQFTAGPAFCDGGADTIFCGNFESTTFPPDVITGEINLPVANNFNGSALDLVTGTYLPFEADRIDDFNLFASPPKLGVFWYSNFFPGQGGVSTNATSFDVLQSGAVIGPDSPISGALRALTTNWTVGADGYFGIKFLNEETGAMNYGYIHVTTSAPDGFPAQVLEYGYNSAGNAITIP